MRKIKKINWKSKKTWKNALVIGLACLTIIGAFVGLGSLVKRSEETTKEIKPSYAIGGLTENGQYLETEKSIYTKNAFECQGLDIDLAFDNNISYQVFFYDEDGDFLEKTSKLTTNYDKGVPFLSTHARIVITPNDDDKISWYEKSGYAKQLTISVNKEQKFETNETENLFVNYKDGYGFNVEGAGQYNEKDGKSSTDVIDISNYSKVVVSGDNMPFAVCVYNKDGSYEMVVFDDNTFVNNSWVYVVNANTSSLVLSYDTGNVYNIIGIR